MVKFLTALIGIASPVLMCHVVNVGWGWFVTPALGFTAPGVLVLYTARLMFFAWSFRFNSIREQVEQAAWDAQVKASPELTAAVENATVNRVVDSVAFALVVWGVLAIIHLFA